MHEARFASSPARCADRQRLRQAALVGCLLGGGLGCEPVVLPPPAPRSFAADPAIGDPAALVEAVRLCEREEAELARLQRRRYDLDVWLERERRRILMMSDQELVEHGAELLEEEDGPATLAALREALHDALVLEHQRQTKQLSAELAWQAQRLQAVRTHATALTLE